MRTNYIRVPLEVTKEQYDRLTEHTKKNGQTKSGAIRIAIDQYLEQKGSDEKNK